MKTLKRTWADISLDNLEYNYRSIRAHLPQGTKFLGVMKADAYGHGAVPVSRALANLIITKKIPSLTWIPYCWQTPFISKVLLRGREV